MKFPALFVCVIAGLVSPGICLGDESQAATQELGTVIYGAAFSWAGSKSPNKPVYLFDVEQSELLRRLVRDTNRRLRSIGQGNLGTERVEIEFYDNAAELVPKLARIAKTRTDKRGAYRFSDVLPGKRYYVVALAVTEDGVSYSAALTAVVKAGQQLRVDLREINLWYVDAN